MKVLIVDPPSGWMYGFPKPIPRSFESDDAEETWFCENGYPISLIHQGMLKHCRYWEKEVD